MCEHAANLFLTSESNRNGLGNLLVQIGTEIKQRLTPMHVDTGNPLTAYMEQKGRISHEILVASLRPS